MKKRFTEEVESYTVLILHLDEYQVSPRELPPDFRFLERDQFATVRAQEKDLLQQVFDDWEIPYYRKLRGWRTDSPIFVVQGDELVGGVYLCDKNEFDDDPLRGQLHYTFVSSRFRGVGVYSVVFRQVVDRARDWGLRELYLNSDRYMLPEVYLRWGARPWRVINKGPGWSHGRFAGILRMVYPYARRLRRQARRVWFIHNPPCK